MYKATNALDDILLSLRSLGINTSDVPEYTAENAADIHFSSAAPIRLYCTDGQVLPLTDKAFSDSDIAELFHKFCDYSVYRHINEIKEGYITVFGKYRCGLSGTAVKRRGEIISLKNINSMNIRIPRAIPGISKELASCKAELLDGILLVGPPSSGKTTILRDVIQRLQGERCVVVDERQELNWGNTCSDADFMHGFTKEEAISRAIRSLSPRIIVCDELAEKDIDIIKKAVSAGVSFIATVHGDPFSWQRRPLVSELVLSGAFGRVAVLDSRNRPGRIKEVIKLEDIGRSFHSSLWPSCGHIKAPFFTKEGGYAERSGGFSSFSAAEDRVFHG